MKCSCKLPAMNKNDAPAKIKIVSRVPEICKEREIDKQEFIRRCLIWKVCGIDAAKRMYSGDSNIRLQTAALVSVFVLDRPLGDAFLLKRV